MKRIFKCSIGALLLFTLILVNLPGQQAKAQPGVSVSFQTFYDELSPYGQWIDDPSYGYVWAPQVDDGFRPYYSNGRWAMTEYGNTWVSGYDWGWAPFHYGRWTHDSYYGWVWVPGDTWGPAWVNWRQGGGNYGWAPLAPGISINVSFGNYYAPNNWWTFIPQRYIYNPNYYSHYGNGGYGNTYINNTTIINNTYINSNNTYISGPRRGDVERVTGGRVNVYNLRNERNPQKSYVRNNTVGMYRPQVRSTSGERGSRLAPKKAIRAERPIGNAQFRGNNSGNRTVNRAERNTAPGRSNQTARPGSEATMQPGNRNAITRPGRSAMERAQPAERRNAQERIQRTNPGQAERAQQSVRRETMQRNETERRNEVRQRSEQQRSQVQPRTQQEQQRMQAPQREWRRPEPRQNNVERQQPQRQERAQPQRVERAQPQRTERAQPQRVERSQPQRVERQAPQRIERQQPAERRAPQRMERAQPQRVERAQPQRVERAQPQQPQRGRPERGR